MRTTTNLVTAVLVACAGLAGCAEAESEEPTPDEATRTKLYENRTFRVDSGDARVSLRVVRRLGRHEIADTRIAFDVREGQIAPSLDADGALVIDELDLALGDVDVPWEVLGRHVSLTDVELRVDGPVLCKDTDWTSDDLVAFCDLVALPAELGWRYRLGKELLPFGGTYYLDLPVGLVVAPADADALWLWANGTGEGGFPWGEQAIATELTVHLDAYSGLIR